MIETAKRRVLFGLQTCGLPIVPKDEDPAGGLAFDLLEALPAGPRVMTGHVDGLITINVAEADADYREKSRESFHEPYRTVIGHLRHEIGHHYWDQLIRDTDWLTKLPRAVRRRADRLRAGPAAVLRQRTAARLGRPVHQWLRGLASLGGLGGNLGALPALARDAADRGQLQPRYVERRRFASRRSRTTCSTTATRPRPMPFLGWINAWVKLTTVLNETARSMGQPDVYPFVMNRAVVTKLHFVQCVIETRGTGGIRPPTERLAAA